MCLCRACPVVQNHLLQLDRSTRMLKKSVRSDMFYLHPLLLEDWGDPDPYLDFEQLAEDPL